MTSKAFGLDQLRAARAKGVVFNTAASLGSMTVAILSQFVLARVLLNQLGGGVYGVWTTMASTVAVLGLAQLGAGPSLLNRLSATAPNDDAKRQGLVTSALLIQLATAGAGAGLALVIAPFIDWTSLFNTHGLVSTRELLLATTFVAAGAFLKLPFTLVGDVFRALQLGYKASILQITTNLFLIGGTFWALTAWGGLSAVAGAYQVAPIAAGALASVYLVSAFPKLRPDFSTATWGATKSLGMVGAQFSVVSLAGYLLLSSDNLVITHVLGPSFVTPYAFALLLTQSPIRFILQLLDAAWPAWSDAAARGDISWLRAHFWKVTIVSWSALVVATALLGTLGRPFIRWWAGNETAVPSEGLLAAMVFTLVVQGAFLSTSRLVTALGAVHVTAYLGMANAAINLPASILLAHQFGVAGVAMGTAIGYLATSWVLPMVVRKRLRELEHAGT